MRVGFNLVGAIKNVRGNFANQLIERLDFGQFDGVKEEN
jgi:hypothetical protein